MKMNLSNQLPSYPTFVEGIRRAPDRGYTLNPAQTATALKNALRYIPNELHEQLAPEFLEELRTRGRIYGYRYRPEGDLKAKPIDQYKGKCIEGKAFQVMIDNNLAFDVALYPYELVTYGETGQVCQNWMQYRLLKMYLEELTQNQTLVVESGHPLGLFQSHPEAPRVIITNALMVGLYDNQEDWHTAMQLGVANYGQMTAGGWMYIGPQGIVHGTFNTLLNAGRLKLGIPQDGNLQGRLFVSSGLGGMSGAQPKAAEMAGAAAIIAEVDCSRIETRLRQDWVGSVTNRMDDAFRQAHEAMREGRAISIAYHGNIVDLLEYAVKENIPIDLLSDQTSCHAVYDGGYCPASLSFEQRTAMLHQDPHRFRTLVDESLRRHFHAVRTLVERGTYFFDYGNSFMKAVYDAGNPDIARDGDPKNGFIFPSYVEDIMGPELFDYGYGPFRWVCLSGKHEDLVKTDQAAMSSRRRRTTAHRTEVQRNGTSWRGWPHHAGTRPPRRERHGLSLPRDSQHQGRQQHDGRHGGAVLCRQLCPWHEPRRLAQRGRRGHRQGHQRRFRHGVRWLGAGGPHPTFGHAVGRDGRSGPPLVGPQSARHGDGRRVQPHARRRLCHHNALRGG